ncbi:SRPBCC domain-containing protein [Aquisalimonas sp.]|uniref:SRPBCC domain-containing protein n=1 Tax=unclassified Aquisalimonas TaxID=2644645 RepID=UPI0025C1BBC9|nr:SRPBCC domain-containing protein [Aquisalimonas sp.]
MRREIVTEIHIQAAPEAVWEVLLDFPAYPQWNPFITRISGAAETSARLAVTIEPPGKRAMVFRPEVLRALPAQELSWLGRIGMPGLFDGEHRFLLEQDDEHGGTRLIQRETFSGILLPLLWWSMAKPTRAGFEAMNRALKGRAEDTATVVAADTPARETPLHEAR